MGEFWDTARARLYRRLALGAMKTAFTGEEAAQAMHGPDNFVVEERPDRGGGVRLGGGHVRRSDVGAGAVRR